MKKIINGKKYDTKTAQCVGEWDSGHPYNDFNWCSESLYRKKTGEFFLHGEGGALSKYTTTLDQNSWSGGEEIIPMSEKEAKNWAEESLDGDDYEDIFGKVDE